MSLAKKLVLGVSCIVVAGYFGAIHFVAPQYLASSVPALEEAAKSYVNGSVELGRLELADDLTLTVHDLVVRNTAEEKVLTVPELVVQLSPWQALRAGSAVSAVQEVEINSPTLYARMDAKDKWNLSGLIKPTEEKSTAFKALVRINNGYLEADTPYGQWQAGLQGDVDAAANPKYGLELQALLHNEIIYISGLMDSDTVGHLTIKTDNFSLDSFGALLAHYLPLEHMQGSVNKLNLLWTNDGKAVGFAGAGRLKEVNADYTGEDQNIHLDVDGAVRFNKLAIEADGLDVVANGQRGKVYGGVDLADSSNPRLSNLRLAFQDFDLYEVMPSWELQGPIEGKLTLNGELDKLQLDGQLEAPKLRVQNLSLTKVALPISMENNKIVLSGAEASLGEGKLQLVAEYNQESGELYGMANMVKLDVGQMAPGSQESVVVNGEMGLEGKVTSGKMHLNSLANLATLQWRGTNFHNLAFDVDIAGTSYTINNLSGFNDEGGAVVAEGTIAGGQLDLQATAARINLAQPLQYLGQEGSGYLSGRFHIGGTTSQPTAEGLLGLTNAVLAGQPIADAHGPFSWQQNTLQLHAFELNMQQGEHKVNGSVNLAGAEPVLDLRVDTDNVRVEPLAALADSELKLTGNLTNSMSLSGPLSQLSVVGTLHASDGSCKGFLVDDVTGDYTYEKGLLALSGFHIKTLTTDISLDGKMLPNGSLDFAIKALNINLKRLPKLSDYGNFEGMINVNGRLRGTTAAPVFVGAIESPKVKINGEELNSIDFNFESADGGNANTLQGSFLQAAGGAYEADLYLDIADKLLRGTIQAENGDVASICRIANLDLALTGTLNGKIDISPEGKGSGVHMQGKLNDAAIRGISFSDVDFDALYKQKVLSLNTFRAVEHVGSLIAAQGTMDFAKRKIDMEAAGMQVSGALLTAFMTDPVALSGQLNFAAQVSGNLDNPDGNASLQLTQGTIAGINFDSLIGMATLRNDMFKLEQLLLTKDVYKVSAYGTFPADLLRAKEARRNRGAQMDLQIHLDEANLGILPTLTKWVDWAEGNTSGSIKVTGTLEEPYMDGKVVIDKGTVKLKTVKTLIEDLRSEIDFAGRSVKLKEFYAGIGKDGSVMAHGNFALTDADTSPYSLDFDAQNVQIESEYFDGTINASGEVIQKRNRPHINAEIRLDDVLLNIPGVPEMGEGQSNIGMDVDLVLGPKIHLYNKYFYDLWVKGGLQFRGSTRFPVVQGALEAERGTISYLRTPFNVKQATLAFPVAGSFMPSINLEATTHFTRYAITAEMHSPADNMNLTLTSQPAKTRAELLRMLTLKTESTGDGVSTDDMQGFLDAGLQMTFLGDVEDYIKRSIGLSEFKIYSGNVHSSLGFDIDNLRGDAMTPEEKRQYNVLVSKHVTKNVLVGYTTSFDGEEHSAFAGLNLTDKLTLNYSQDEKNRHWYGVQYQTAF